MSCTIDGGHWQEIRQAGSGKGGWVEGGYLLRTLRGTKILIFIVKTLSRGAGSVIMCCRCICSCHCISVSVSDFATFVPTKTAHVAKRARAGVCVCVCEGAWQQLPLLLLQFLLPNCYANVFMQIQFEMQQHKACQGIKDKRGRIA